MNKKIATEIALGIILVIAIVVGGAVWFSGNQKTQAPTVNVKTTQPVPQAEVMDEAASWQTYTNQKYGYEIKYPQNISVSDAEARTDIAYNSSQQGTIFSLDANSKITVMVWHADVAPAFDSQDFKDFEKITINGKKAVKGRDYGNAYFLEAYVFGSVYTYQIEYAGDENAKNIDVYNKMISTFDFLALDPDVSGWQTYRNEKYGFEFQYPNGWMIDINNDSPKPENNTQRIFLKKNVNSAPIIFTVFSNQQRLSARQWLQKQSAEQSLIDSLFNGYVSVKLDNPVVSSYFIYLSRGENVISIDVTRDIEGVPADVVDQFLSTFKFTK